MDKKLFYTEEELPQRSDEWLEARKGSVGGSDVAGILGLMDKYTNARKMWKRETGRLKPKAENDAMKRGALMEDEAKVEVIKHLEDVEGVKNPKLEMFFARHPDFPEVAVSFDGVDIENKYIVELKCPKFYSIFKSVFEDGIQDYYYPQVQLQLAIANAIWGIEKAYFCSYYPDGAYILDMFNFKEVRKTLAVIDIDYDPKYFQEMLKVVKVYRKFIDEDYFDQEELNKAVEEFKRYES